MDFLQDWVAVQIKGWNWRSHYIVAKAHGQCNGLVLDILRYCSYIYIYIFVWFCLPSPGPSFGSYSRISRSGIPLVFQSSQEHTLQLAPTLISYLLTCLRVLLLYTHLISIGPSALSFRQPFGSVQSVGVVRRTYIYRYIDTTSP